MEGYDVLPLNVFEIPLKNFDQPPRTATVEEFQKLLSVIPRNNDPRHIRNLAIVSLFWDTGARNSELMSINTDRLDLEAKTIIIKTAKNRGSNPFRPIYWEEMAHNNLLSWMKTRESIIKRKNIRLPDPNALFICLSGSRVGHRLTNKGVGEMLRNYSKKADIYPILNAHSFRHAKGHSIIKGGGSNTDVAGSLGHSNLLSSMVYTNLSDPDKKERSKLFMVTVEDPLAKKKPAETIATETFQVPIPSITTDQPTEIPVKIPIIMPDTKMPPVEESLKHVIEYLVIGAVKNLNTNQENKPIIQEKEDKS